MTLFDWPGRERYARFQELLAPLLEDKQYMAAEELDARFWFASRCSAAASKYLRSLSDAVERGEFDPERLSVYAEVFETMAQIQQARLYESVRIALENGLSNPTEYQREVGGFVPEYMILDKIEEARKNARSASEAADKTREHLSDELADNGFESVEAMWEALLREAADILGTPSEEKQAR
jgi:hypothetical protein